MKKKIVIGRTIDQAEEFCKQEVILDGNLYEVERIVHDGSVYFTFPCENGCGKEWLSYTLRRLKEFKNIKFVARNLIKEK